MLTILLPIQESTYPAHDLLLSSNYLISARCSVTFIWVIEKRRTIPLFILNSLILLTYVSLCVCVCVCVFLLVIFSLPICHHGSIMLGHRNQGFESMPPRVCLFVICMIVPLLVQRAETQFRPRGPFLSEPQFEQGYYSFIKVFAS